MATEYISGEFWEESLQMFEYDLSSNVYYELLDKTRDEEGIREEGSNAQLAHIGSLIEIVVPNLRVQKQ